MVPQSKRPPLATRDTAKQETYVIRLTIDERFTDGKQWKKLTQNPGATARAWMKEVAFSFRIPGDGNLYQVLLALTQ